jgi:cytoskeletal protein RodZ
MSDHQSLGGVIRSTRENSGYSFSDLEQATKIPKYILKDIEQDKFDSAGGNTYARGHIRTLAKFLKADSEKWLSRFEEQNSEIDRSMSDLLIENNVTPAQPEKRNISYKTLGIAAGIVVVLTIAVPALMSFTNSSDSSSSTNSNQSGAPSSAVATKTSEVVVTISGVSDKSWVGIQDAAGVQVFSGRIAIGQSQTFSNPQQLNVIIGNAGAVNLKVNGKDLGTPGAIGEVVRLSFSPNQSSQG